MTGQAPCLGIFWRVRAALITERTPLDNAVPYGDCLTHDAGHVECWAAWQALGAAGLAAAGLPAEIAFTDYDDWPLGRIVFDRTTRRFVIYGDRRLHNRPIIGRLATAFDLPATGVAVRSDTHYRRGARGCPSI